MKRSAAKGQAIIETSLSLLVAVSVIVLGIHLAEVMSIAVKAPMLAHSLLFDASAYEVRIAGPAPVVTQMNNRFPGAAADLDLRSSATGTVFRGAFTSVPPVGVVAAQVPPLMENAPGCTKPPNDPYALVPTSIDSGWAIGIDLALTVRSLRVPGHFADGNSGFFKEQPLTRTAWDLCAVGRRVGSTCTGSFKLLLDDRAMHKETPTDEWDRRSCDLYGCSNTRFKDSAAAHFGSGTGAASVMATSMIVGPSPVDETEFWMSFRDNNSAFMENGFETGIGPASRGACWLGKACP